jgi:hypothetical protein
MRENTPATVPLKHRRGPGDARSRAMFVRAHRDYSLHVREPIVAVVWRGAVTEGAVCHIERVLFRAASEWATPIAFVTIANYRAPVPTPEIRKRIADCYAALGTKLDRVAQVVVGEGFWACTARCVIASIVLLTKGRHRMAVFGSVAEASEWLGLDGPQRERMDVLTDSSCESLPAGP